MPRPGERLVFLSDLVPGLTRVMEGRINEQVEKVLSPIRKVAALQVFFLSAGTVITGAQAFTSPGNLTWALSGLLASFTLLFAWVFWLSRRRCITTEINWVQSRKGQFPQGAMYCQRCFLMVEEPDSDNCPYCSSALRRFSECR